MALDLKKLREPFYPDEIEWKVMTCGKSGDKIWARVLAYITSRAIMDRLDNVVGADLWKNEFKAGPSGGVLCGISIKIEGEWVTKWDGAENTDIEAVKGGFSGAMKRAAVQWGIGRYLYDLEENFAQVIQSGIYSAKTKEGVWFNWNPPNLPKWALPNGTGVKSDRATLPPREAPAGEADAKTPGNPPPPPPPPQGQPGTPPQVRTKRTETIELFNESKPKMTEADISRIRANIQAAGTTDAMLDEVVKDVRASVERWQAATDAAGREFDSPTILPGRGSTSEGQN